MERGGEQEEGASEQPGGRGVEGAINYAEKLRSMEERAPVKY